MSSNVFVAKKWFLTARYYLRKQQKRLGQNISFSFFSVRNKKTEPRHSAIPVFFMLI